MKKARFHRIRIFFRVDERVVEAMIVGPSENAPLRCKATEKEEDCFDSGMRLIGAMGIEAVIARGNGEA